MTKRLKIILSILFASLFVVLCIVSSFADYSTIEEYYTVEPADLGDQLSSNAPQFIPNQIVKYYLEISPYSSNEPIYARVPTGDSSQTYIQAGSVVIENNTLKVNLYTNNNNDYWYILMCTRTIEYDSSKTYYIPIFTYNCSVYRNTSTSPRNYNFYYASTETVESNLIRQQYELGYASGYNDGESAGIILGQDLKHELDLVGHLNQFMGMFIGEDHAKYITPIAVVLIILLCYFLFIRWLLALINSKNVTKISDICVCTACIIVLVVMFAPMLNLTIKTESITQEATYETSIEEVESIRSSGIRIEHTETGDIYYGPVGTVIFPVTEHVDEVYKVQSDIETEVILYETRG